MSELHTDQAEVDRLHKKHRDIWTYGGAGALKREAAKRERQMRMDAFVSTHKIACFKCGTRLNPWVKTGFSRRGPWALCVMCVRTKKEADSK